MPTFRSISASDYKQEGHDGPGVTHLSFLHSDSKICPVINFSGHTSYCDSAVSVVLCPSTFWLVNALEATFLVLLS